MLAPLQALRAKTQGKNNSKQNGGEEQGDAQDRKVLALTATLEDLLDQRAAAVKRLQRAEQSLAERQKR